MEKYKIQIKEKEKFIRKLSFLNLRDEVTNFMYKKTIASASRRDLLLFVLIFFLSIKKPNAKNSLLYSLLEQNLEKLQKFNKFLEEKRVMLKQGEYEKIKEKFKLTDALKYDVLFLLIEGVTDAEILKIKYSDFFKKNKELLKEFDVVVAKFGQQVDMTYLKFKEFHIEDDRYDEETGEHYDLSKSVYRPVKMRLRRKLDISLQQFTEIKEIKSESPIIVDFIQSVDPDIIFELWEKYHLVEYLKGIYDLIKNNVSLSLNLDLGDLIIGYILWKTTDGRKKKEKEEKNDNFKQKKTEYLKKENSLLKALNSSLQKTQESLEKEIENLENRLGKLEKKSELTGEENQLKKAISLELKKLKNLSVTVVKMETHD